MATNIVAISLFRKLAKTHAGIDVLGASFKIGDIVYAVLLRHNREFPIEDMFQILIYGLQWTPVWKTM